jgi:hypothetical protein
LTEVITHIIPKCNFDIQGLIFFPKQSGVSVIFVDKTNMKSETKVEISNTSTNVISSSYHMIHDLKNFLISRDYSYETIGKKKNLLIKKTPISDVYDVYEQNSNDEKIGIAHIPNIKISQNCYNNIKDESYYQCVYHKEFNKWIPIKSL